MKKYFIIIFVLFFGMFFGANFSFAENTSTGIIPGQIWYSKQPLTEGGTVAIHTVVWNGESSSLYTTVEFYDKNVILGSREVIIAAGSSKDVSVSWKVTAGDHVISAAITSSKIAVAGGTEKLITLESRTTNEDKQFVSKVIENIDGTPATSTAVIKDKINETTSQIADIVPPNVSASVGTTFSLVEDFRNQTSNAIEESKTKTKEKIAELDKTISSSSDIKTTTTTNSNADKKSTTSDKNISPKKVSTGIDGTERPIAYVKFFLLSIVGFIFGSKIIFYLVGVFIVFIILRFIWRKIRRK